MVSDQSSPCTAVNIETVLTKYFTQDPPRDVVVHGFLYSETSVTNTKIFEEP